MSPAQIIDAFSNLNMSAFDLPRQVETPRSEFQNTGTFQFKKPESSKTSFPKPNSRKELSVSEKLDLLRASEFKTVVVGLSGSVAAIKAQELIGKLISDKECNVILVQTNNARHFTERADSDWKIDLSSFQG